MVGFQCAGEQVGGWGVRGGDLGVGSLWWGFSEWGNGV